MFIMTRIKQILHSIGINLEKLNLEQIIMKSVLITLKMLQLWFN